MNTFDWREFLERWSQKVLASMEDRLNQLPMEVIKSGWLGYPGATEEDIVQTEIRLQTKLPPSYRDFLKVTNGWRQTTPFIYRIWSIEEVEWFSVRHQDWIGKFVLEHDEFRQTQFHRNNGASSYRDILNSEYFVYGEQQDCSKLRIDYLKTALEISDKGESSIYLLNPQVVTENGEWEAWFFGDWLPGADRYRSFKEMMQAEYQIFLELIESSTNAEDIEAQSDESGYTAKDNRIQQWIDQSKKNGENLSQDNSDLIKDQENDIYSSSEITHRESNIPQADPKLNLAEVETEHSFQNNDWQNVQSFFMTYQIRQVGDNVETRLQIHQATTDIRQTWPVKDIKQLPMWILTQIKELDSSSNPP